MFMTHGVWWCSFYFNFWHASSSYIYICICVLNFHASLLITCAWHESPPDLLKLEKSKRKGSMNSQIWECLKEKIDGWRCEGCCAWLGWSRFEGLELIHQTTKCQQGRHKNSALGGTLRPRGKKKEKKSKTLMILPSKHLMILYTTLDN